MTFLSVAITSTVFLGQKKKSVYLFTSINCYQHQIFLHFFLSSLIKFMRRRQAVSLQLILSPTVIYCFRKDFSAYWICWEIFPKAVNYSRREDQFLTCMWRHHFLKSKTKEPPKFLSSSGVRMGKLTFAYNFSAQWLALSGNQRILNFRVMAVRDMKLRARLLKYNFLCHNFQPIQRLKY